MDNESQHFCNALLSSPLLKIKDFTVEKRRVNETTSTASVLCSARCEEPPPPPPAPVEAAESWCKHNNQHDLQHGSVLSCPVESACPRALIFPFCRLFCNFIFLLKTHLESKKPRKLLQHLQKVRPLPTHLLSLRQLHQLHQLQKHLQSPCQKRARR